MALEITKKEMRQQVKEYTASTHPTKKYRKETLNILCEMWKRSQRSKCDLWAEISDLKHPQSNNKINGSVIKSNFRSFLQKSQKDRCCYCRQPLANIAHAKPVEHILPRLHYPQFSLHFWNLAVACVDCNGVKLKDVWGTIDMQASVYPPPSEFFNMYHPRFHIYENHVEYIWVEKNGLGVSIYKGLTDQGRHLCLNLLHKISAKRILIEGDAELQDAMSELGNYQRKVDGIELPKLNEFAISLNDSVLAFLGD